MPADRRLPMNLITCESGSISLEELMTNESQEAYIRALIKGIKSMVSNPVDMIKAQLDTKSSNLPMSFYDENGVWWAYAYKYIAQSTINKQQLPLIQTKWGQESPWDINAPYISATSSIHCPTGCTNVAIAQLLYYLHYKNGVPEKTYRHFGTYSHYDSSTESATGHILTSDEVAYSDFSDCWSDMPLTMNSASDVGARIVSSLMVRLGYLLKAQYASDGTGVNVNKVKSVLSSNFNISSTYADYDATIMEQQISSSKNPVVIFMWRNTSDPEPNNIAGHTVIADGYKKTTETYTYVYKTMDSSSTIYKYIEDAEVYVNEYVSLNWGYNGDGDRDPNNGGVIWYNLEIPFSYNSKTYDLDNMMLYNFN